MKKQSSFMHTAKQKFAKLGVTLGIIGTLIGIGSTDAFSQTTDKKAEQDSVKNKKNITIGNISIDSDAKIDSKVKSVYDDNGNVIGQEKNGVFYYPEETEIRGDTTITTYGHGSFYSSSIKTGDDSEVSAADITPQKATNEQIQAYKDRWAKLQKENNWTNDELRAAQKEEDRKYREFLAKQMPETQTNATEQQEALAVEKLIIKEIKGETIYQTEYSMLPHLAAIPVITKDSWLVGIGGVHRETDELNRTPFEKDGFYGQFKSPSLLNREIIKIGADIQLYKGFEYATIIPEYVDQDDEANINAVDAFINKDGKNKWHTEAQAYVEIGYTFNFFKPRNDLDPALYTVNEDNLDNHGRFKHLGIVKLRIAGTGGVFYHEPFEYTVKENEWDPAATYIIPAEQQNAEPGLGTYYGARAELSVNLGKVKRQIVSRKTGEKLSLEDYQERRQALLDEITEDAVIISEVNDVAENNRNTQNALKLMQLETAQKLREFEDNQFEVRQKRVGVELFGGGHFMRTSFEPTNVAPFSNEGVIGAGEGTFVDPNVNIVYVGLRLRF